MESRAGSQEASPSGSSSPETSATQAGAQAATGSGADDASTVGAGDAATAESEATDEGIPIHGQITARYRGRWTSDYANNDVFAYITLDVGDPAKNTVTAHADMRGSAVLDGLVDSGPFQDILDTYDHDVNGRLYTAYVDLHRMDGLDKLRIGRIEDYMTPVLAFFDGVALETEPLTESGLKLGTYGGRPVHLYADSTQGDWLFGMYGESRPWEGGRVRLDYMKADQEVSQGTIGADLWNLALWQRLDKWRFEGSTSWLDGESRDLRLGGTWTDLQRDARVRMDLYSLLNTQFAQPIEFDWFSTSLFELKPYSQVRLLGEKRWDRRYRLQAGMDLRRVSDSGDEGAYNRNVDRYYLTGAIERIFTDSNVFSVTGDTWNGNGTDYDTISWDFSHVFSERTRGSFGSYYSLYSIQIQTGEEQEDVRTWFVRYDRQINEAWQLEARFDYEDTSIDDFYVFRVKLAWRF